MKWLDKDFSNRSGVTGGQEYLNEKRLVFNDANRFCFHYSAGSDYLIVKEASRASLLLPTWMVVRTMYFPALASAASVTGIWDV